jgi:hypothetical protein
VRALAGALIVASLLAGSAQAQTRTSEPLGYEGFALGGSLADFRTRFPDFRCDAASCSFGPDTCVDLSKPPSEIEPCRKRNTLASVVPSLVRASFAGGRLAAVLVEFEPTLFDWLAEAMAGRYGSPTTAYEEVVREAGGSAYENRVRVWRRPNGVLEIRKHGERADRGRLSIVSDAR